MAIWGVSYSTNVTPAFLRLSTGSTTPCPPPLPSVASVVVVHNEQAQSSHLLLLPSPCRLACPSTLLPPSPPMHRHLTFIVDSGTTGQVNSNIGASQGTVRFGGSLFWVIQLTSSYSRLLDRHRDRRAKSGRGGQEETSAEVHTAVYVFYPSVLVTMTNSIM